MVELVPPTEREFAGIIAACLAAARFRLNVRTSAAALTEGLG
jgi:hypothetical protein